MNDIHFWETSKEYNVLSIIEKFKCFTVLHSLGNPQKKKAYSFGASLASIPHVKKAYIIFLLSDTSAN